jgi:hypothetical protein
MTLVTFSRNTHLSDKIILLFENVPQNRMRNSVSIRNETPSKQEKDIYYWEIGIITLNMTKIKVGMPYFGICVNTISISSIMSLLSLLVEERKIGLFFTLTKV